MLGVVIAHAERLHVAEAGETAGADGGFRPAADHRISIAELNDAPGFADVVVRGRAGGDDGHVRPHEAVLGGDHAAGDVGDHHRNDERRDARRRLRQQHLILRFDGAETTDAAADHDADAMRIEAVRIEAGILRRQLRRRHGELEVAVRTAGVLVIVEVAGGIKVHHLATDFAVVLRGVHGLEPADAAFACQDVLPKVVFGVADGGEDSHAGDDDATLAHE